MSSFNKIFSLVKKHSKENSISGAEAFEQLAAEAAIPLDRLHFYLECLQEVGVIQYSSKDKVITLTSKGIKANRVSS